jgi:hypothetical protein
MTVAEEGRRRGPQRYRLRSLPLPRSAVGPVVAIVCGIGLLRPLAALQWLGAVQVATAAQAVWPAWASVASGAVGLVVIAWGLWSLWRWYVRR